MSTKEKGTKVPKGLAKIFGALHARVYKLTRGRLGADMRGNQIVILETLGAKSGKVRSTPLMAVETAGGWSVVASFSGHDAHPGWYHNLMANPEASLLVGNRTHQVLARDTEGAERAELWDSLAESYPSFAKYQRATDRVSPVVSLSRR